MTTHDDLDRQLNHFLREGPTELPDPSFDAVRDRTEQTRQRAVIGSWRVPDMNKFLAIGLGAAAVVVLLVVGANLFGPFGPQPGGEPSLTPAPSTEPSTAPSVAGGLPEGPHLLWEGTDSEPLPITVTIPGPLWQGASAEGYVCRSDSAFCAGGPDGAGVQSFEGPDYYVYGDACHASTTKPDTPATTVDELIGALALQGSREASAPEYLAVDGYAATKIVLQMALDGDISACDGGEAALFGYADRDPARGSNGPGQVEEVWAVDVDGLVVVLDGVYYADTPQDALDEVHAILASATFEVP